MYKRQAFTAEDLADHYAVLLATGKTRLIPHAYNPATMEMRLSVDPLPPGRMFHLRGSTDLRAFYPLEPAVNFDISTPQPLIIHTGGESLFFLQLFEGETP